MLMISKSEGTNYLDGYHYLFGSNPHNDIRFENFAQHPHIIQEHNGIRSSAAGRYQILYFVWHFIQQKYALPDFSPESQDIACVELISEVNSLQKLMDGKFDYALNACNKIWASLPGSLYNQPTHKKDIVTAWYKDAGGYIT